MGTKSTGAQQLSFACVIANLDGSTEKEDPYARCIGPVLKPISDVVKTNPVEIEHRYLVLMINESLIISCILIVMAYIALHLCVCPFIPLFIPKLIVIFN